MLTLKYISAISKVETEFYYKDQKTASLNFPKANHENSFALMSHGDYITVSKTQYLVQENKR